jgi:hypothetical protein
MNVEEDLRSVHQLLEEAMRLLYEGRAGECREILDTAHGKLTMVLDQMRLHASFD